MESVDSSTTTSINCCLSYETEGLLRMLNWRSEAFGA